MFATTHAMVFILDGNSGHVAHGRRKLFRKKVGISTSLDLIKCLKPTKKQRLLLTRAPVSELPSNISSRAHAESLGWLMTYCSQLLLCLFKTIRRVCVITPAYKSTLWR